MCCLLRRSAGDSTPGSLRALMMGSPKVAGEGGVFGDAAEEVRFALFNCYVAHVQQLYTVS